MQFFFFNFIENRDTFNFISRLWHINLLGHQIITISCSVCMPVKSILFMSQILHVDSEKFPPFFAAFAYKEKKNWPRAVLLQHHKQCFQLLYFYLHIFSLSRIHILWWKKTKQNKTIFSMQIANYVIPASIDQFFLCSDTQIHFEFCIWSPKPDITMCQINVRCTLKVRERERTFFNPILHGVNHGDSQVFFPLL